MHTFQIKGFNSILGVFYMFQMLCVHLQEDHLFMQFLW